MRGSRATTHGARHGKGRLSLVWWSRSPPRLCATALADFGTVTTLENKGLASVRFDLKVRKAPVQVPTNFRIGTLAHGLLAAGAILVLSACTASAPSQNQPSPVVEGTVHVCSSCHGLGGSSVSPTFPRLAGQQQEYIEAQLKAFRDHTRADPHAHTYMWGMAATLSDETIAGVAAYYSSQPPVAGQAGDPADMAAGKKIFEEGIDARSVPACKGCHGEHAEGNGPIPRLAGQHRGYLEEQLTNFASNARANEIMHENSKNLTPDEIREVTAYLAAQ